MFLQREHKCDQMLLNLENKLAVMDDVHEIKEMNKLMQDMEGDMKEDLGTDAITAEERSIGIEDVFSEVNDVSDAYSRPHAITSGSRQFDDDDLDEEFDALSDSESEEDVEQSITPRSRHARSRHNPQSSSARAPLDDGGKSGGGAASSRLGRSIRASTGDSGSSAAAATSSAPKNVRRGATTRATSDLVDDYGIPTH